jgi:hypothetical protein
MLKTYLFTRPRSSKFVLTFLFLFLFGYAQSQNNSVAIGSETVNEKAVLMLVGTDQGLMIPVVSSRNDIGATASEEGMIVYDNTDNKIHFFNGTAWVELGGGSGGGGSYAIQLTGSNLQLLENGNPVGAAIDIQSVTVAGDASGTIGNLTVSSIQGNAVNGTTLNNTTDVGKVMQWDGSEWMATALASGSAVTAGNGIAINGSEISVNEAQLTDADATNEIQDAAGVAVTATGNLTSTDVQSALVELQTELDSGGSTDDQVATEVPVTAQNGVTSTDTQAALEELQGEITTNQTNVGTNTSNVATNTAAIAGATDDQVANEVTVTATGNLTSTDVQSALVELQTELDSGGSTDDQVATEVPVTAQNGVTSTDTQAALEELQGEITANQTNVGTNTTNVATNTVAIAAATDDQVANEVTVTATGNLTSTDVQSALVELQGDIDGATTLPATTDSQIIISSGTNPTAVAMGGDATINNTGTITISNDAITSAEITDGTVGTVDMTNDAVTTGKIADGTIVNADINDVAASKTTVSTITNLTATDVQGALAELQGDIDVAVGLPATTDSQVIVSNGTTPTATTLSGDATIDNVGVITIANNAVTSIEITDGSVATVDITNDAVTTGKIADGTIVDADINDVAASKASVSAITNLTATDVQTALAEHQSDIDGIAALPATTDGQVIVSNGTTPTGATMGGDATIDNAGVITIASNAITSTEITDGTVGTADISDDAVSLAKLANGAASGEIMRYDGANWILDIGANKWTTGAVPANNGDGELDGSYYLDTSTGEIYYKIAGAYASVGNIQGTDGIDGDKYGTTSSTSLNPSPAIIGNTFIITLDDTGLAYTAGQTIIAASLADPANDNFEATVLSYDGSTALNVIATVGNGAGNHTDWEVNLTGAPGAAGQDAYTYIGYASDVGGTGFTTTAGALEFIGFVTSTTLLTPVQGDFVSFTRFRDLTLADGNIYVGNAGTQTEVVLNGDVTITNTGAVTITNDAVTTGKILDGTIVSADIADVAASKATVTSITNLTATDVQAALAELQGDIDGAADNQTAAEVPVTAITNLTATDVQAALAEHQVDIDGIAALPATTDGQIIVSNGATPTATTMSGDATIDNTGAISIATNAVGSTEITDGSVGTIDITNDAITTGKIADGTIVNADINDVAASKASVTSITNLTATNVQGALAELQGDIDGIAALPVTTDGQILVSNGTTPTGITMSGDATIDNAGVLVISSGAITSTEITDGSVSTIDITNDAITSGKIADGTIINADINNVAASKASVTAITNLTATDVQAALSEHQVDIDGISGLPGMTDAQLIISAGTTPDAQTVGGDATLAVDGTLTLANATGTRTNLGLGALATQNAVTSTEIVDGTITGTDIAASTISVGNIVPNGTTRSLLVTTTAGNVNWITPVGNNQVIGSDGTGDLVFRNVINAGTGIGTPGLETNLVTEAAVRAAISSASSLQNAYNGGEAINLDAGNFAINNNDGSVPYVTIIPADGNVGIGTSNPASQLEVQGVAGANAGIVVDAPTGFDPFIDFHENGALNANIYWSSGNSNLTINGGANNTTINPNGGNVGIGENAPGSKLSIRPNGPLDGIRILTDAANNQGQLQFADDDEAQAVSIQAPDAVTADYTLTLPPAVGTAGQLLSTDASGNLNWSSPTGFTASNGVNIVGSDIRLGGPLTADTNIDNAGFDFSITGAGNVGIGRASGALRMMVEDDANGNNPVIAITTTDAVGDAAFGFGNASGTNFTMGIDQSDGNLFKISNGTALGTTDRMTIDNFGHVGFGTSAPNLNFQLHDAASSTTLQITSATQSANNDGLWIQQSSTQNASILNREAGSLSFGTSASTRMLIDAAGNVGIGTNSPSTKLEVQDAGNSFMRVTTGSTSAGLELVRTSGTDWRISNDNGEIVFSRGTDDFATAPITEFKMNVLGFKPEGDNSESLGLVAQRWSELHSVDGHFGGNVGIGTAPTTSYALALNSGTAATALRLDNTVAGNTLLDIYNNGSLASRLQATSTTTALISQSTRDIDLFTNGTSRLNIDGSSGSVGIGTTSPSASYALDVAGDIRTNELLATGGGSWGTDELAVSSQDIYFTNANAHVIIGTSVQTAQNKLDIEGGMAIGVNYSGSTTAPTNGAIIEGNVGIGTNSAGSPLTVVSTSSTMASFTNASTNAYTVLSAASGSNAYDIYREGSTNRAIVGVNGVDDSYRIYNGSATGTPVFTAVSNQVGIGTISPASKLDVEGGVTIGAAYSGSSAAPVDGVIIQGNVGIGTTAPAAKFHINSAAAEAPFRAQINNSTKLMVQPDGTVTVNTPTDQAYAFYVNGSAAKTSGTAWTNTSDRRLKDIHGDYDGGLDLIRKIDPIWFSYNGKGGIEKGERQVGIIAQDLQKIAPYTVSTFEAKINEDDETTTDLLNFNFNAINYAQINAIKELADQIDSLKEKNISLTKELEAIKSTSTTSSLSTTERELLKAEIMKEVQLMLGIEAKNSTEKKE